MNKRTLQLWPEGRSITVSGEYPDLKVHDKSKRGRKATPEEARAVRINELALSYQRNEILCLDNIVDDLARADDSGELSGDLRGEFGLEKWENVYADPSRWDLQECREFLEERAYDLESLPSPDKFAEFPSVDELREKLLRAGFPARGAIAVIYCDSDGWTDVGHVPNSGGLDTLLAACGVQESDDDGTRFHQAIFGPEYPQLWEEGLQALAAECRRVNDDRVADIEEEDILEQWQEACREYTQEEANEVYQWFRVSSWLCGALRDAGEVILDNAYGYWWGRGCCGQDLIMDGVLQRIAASVVDR